MHLHGVVFKVFCGKNRVTLVSCPNMTGSGIHISNDMCWSCVRRQWWSQSATGGRQRDGVNIDWWLTAVDCWCRICRHTMCWCWRHKCWHDWRNYHGTVTCKAL